METKYKTEVYNIAKTVFCTFLFIIIITLLLSAIGIYFKTPILGGAGFALGAILPFAFGKKIKRWFTRRYFLEFNDSSFLITKYQFNNDVVSKQLNIKWCDIISYKFNFGGSKNTILNIYLRKGGSKVLNFKENKTLQEAINGESIFTIFRTYVKRYNTDKDVDDRIVLNKGILNSRAGTIIIYSEIGIIIGGFIFHLFMHPQSSFLTLFLGLGLVIQLFIRRNQDKDLYDKISKLD